MRKFINVIILVVIIIASEKIANAHYNGSFGAKLIICTILVAFFELVGSIVILQKKRKN